MRFSFALLAVLLLLAACGEPAPEPLASPRTGGAAADAWTDVDAARLTTAQQAQAAKAVAARDNLASRLQARLRVALENGGASAAIGVCRNEAPGIAADVARAEGVRIGRTSHRLRSLMNGAPPWAYGLVATRRDTPALLAHADGRLAALHPIRTQALCLGCHGAPQTLAPEVRAALERDYPADQATGFAEGDLRGWFWIEVPGR